MYFELTMDMERFKTIAPFVDSLEKDETADDKRLALEVYEEVVKATEKPNLFILSKLISLAKYLRIEEGLNKKEIEEDLRHLAMPQHKDSI